MTRPSPLPSAPSHSPRPAGICPAGLANQYLGIAYEVQGDYGQAIDCFRQTVASLEGTQRYDALWPGYPTRCALPCLARLCHAELGAFAEGRSSEKKGSGLPRQSTHPAEPHVCLLWDRSAGPPPRATYPGRSPCSNGPGHLSGSGPPSLFPCDGCGLGRGVYPGRARRRRACRCSTQVLEQVMCNGHSRRSGALWSRPRGGAAAGWPSGGGTRPRRAHAGARP